MSDMHPTLPGSSRAIFADAEQQASFERTGYVIEDFLGGEERAALLDLFDRTVRRERNTYAFFSSLKYYISIFDTDTAKRKEVDRAVKAIFEKKIERLMRDYRILLCNFMAKQPGGVGEIQVHQDFTFVDEDRFVGFNLWVPLEDTDLQNGCFYMIPGSNRLLRSYRAASITESLTRYNETLKRYMTPKPIKAGTGIVFDHRLFHYSPENQSDRWRPAVQLVLIPREAQAILLRHDPQKDPGHLVVHGIDEDYLTERNLWEPAADLTVLGTKPFIPLPDEKELLRMVEGLPTEARA
jgi:Phytanoyl-CoA dioxygenase (PhyH)